MTKAKIIGQIRIAAERDLSISHGALRLLYRQCSEIFTNPRAKLENAFPLPWSKVAVWVGLKDADACARLISELVDKGYLKRDGLRGCPAMNYFFLVSSYRPGAVTGYRSGGATSYRSGGARHISNSFQEEKIKVKREENGSLRSAETKGAGLAAQARAEGERQRQLLSQLKASLKPSPASPTVARSEGVKRGGEPFEKKTP